MKVRNGFVSNSSSSSFIVEAKTTKEVIKAFLLQWANNRAEDSDAELREDIFISIENVLKRAEKLEDTNSNKTLIITGLNKLYEQICEYVPEIDSEELKTGYPVKVLKRLNQAMQHIDNADDNEKFVMPWTCNYATVVSKLDENKVFVDTCNNECWYDLYDILTIVGRGECFEDIIESGRYNLNGDMEYLKEEDFLLDIETGKKVKCKDI